MDFHGWTTIYECALRGGTCLDVVASRVAATSPVDFYRHPQTVSFRKSLAWYQAARMDAEETWYGEHRPYYSVYPSIVQPLVRLRLDIDSGSVPHPPLPSLVVRFAKGFEPAFAPGCFARAMLLSQGTSRQGDRVLLTWVDVGKRTPLDGGNEFVEVNAHSIPLRAGTTLEQSLEEAAQRTSMPRNEFMTEMISASRLAGTLCLLGQDPQIIEPDVLAKDRAKWERTHDLAIVERAVRRGKLGWLVGGKLEVMPHVRRPHMALRWTGPGGKEPRIVPVKGSIVHREKVEHLPTGRLDQENMDDDGSKKDDTDLT